jgi:hypothetical protein
MSQRLNRQLGITGRRKRKEPVPQKHPIKRIRTEQKCAQRKPKLLLLLMSWHACFSEDICGIVFSFLNRRDAIWFGLKDVLFDRMTRRLEKNKRRPFVGTIDRTELGTDPTKRVVIQQTIATHFDFADSFFAATLYEIVQCDVIQYGKVASPIRFQAIDWLLEFSGRFLSDIIPAMLPRDFCHFTTAYNQSILYAIDTKNFLLFNKLLTSGLLEPVLPRFRLRWLQKAVEKDGVEFVDYLLRQYRIPKRWISAIHISSVEMLECFHDHGYSFDGQLVSRFLADGDFDLAEWLLEHGVKEGRVEEPIACQTNSTKQPWLSTVIFSESSALDGIRLLNRYRSSFTFNTTILAHAILYVKKLDVVKLLYSLFLNDQPMAFTDATEHEDFLNKYIDQWQEQERNWPWLVDEWSAIYGWMVAFHPMDLNPSLLYLAAVRAQSIEKIHFLYERHLGGLNVNLMDAAVMLPSELICNWLLDHGVCCSQLAMDALIYNARRDVERWMRIATILNHPSSEHLWSQSLYARISRDMPPSFREIGRMRMMANHLPSILSSVFHTVP